VVERADELEVAGTDAQGDGLHRLVVDHLPALHAQPEPLGVDRESGVQVGHGVGDVVQLLHSHWPSIPVADGANPPQRPPAASGSGSTTGSSRGFGRSSRPTFAPARPSTRTTSAVKSLFPPRRAVPTP